MNAERWHQVKQLLDEAIALNVTQRISFLDSRCAGDGEMRREVESLLSSHEQAGTGFLKNPAVDLKVTAAVASARAGCRIGVYQILEEIGHGGMGEVYRALRADGQFTKEVAIKLVRIGFDTASVIERFRSERQILASLDHANIARLLDGGTTEEGIPYLVMELIEGTPIDQFCEQRDLDVADRLRLFRQVCAAVQYAHQRLVVHRDLKPSNILVTAEGVPKLLDFGIAKILGATVGTETTLVRPMTPEYASPEQIRGETITTASDVYSLGVVLYKLLTGRSPYPESARTSLEFARIVCEVEPSRPSTAVSTYMKVIDPANAENESTGNQAERSTRLKRRLKGDLDNIVLKALRKEPHRRYSSVEQMAEDIRRHLEGLPVSATPDSVVYLANKFVRRNKIGVGATALILLAIVAGLAATLREARIASENQHRAEKRFAEVRKIANSLIYEIHDSIVGIPGATAPRQLIVQRSSEYLDSLAREASGDVSLQRELASAYERLGNVQGDMYGSNLGDPTRALESLQKALAMRKSIASENPRNMGDQVALARAYQEIGRIQWFSLGGTDEGLQNLGRAVTSAEAAMRLDSENMAAVEVLARSYQNLGDIQGGSGLRGGTAYLRQALENHLKSLPLLQRMAEADPTDAEKTYTLSRALIGVGDDYVRMGDAAQALKSYERAEEVLRPVAEKVNNSVYRRGYAVCHTRIADALLMSGRPAEALLHYRREREILEPLAAADPKDILVQSTFTVSEGDIGHAMVEAGQVAEGKAILLRALSNTRALAKTAPDSYSRTVLASTIALAGEACERARDNVNARNYYAQALDLYLATVKTDAADLEDAVNLAIVRNHLGGVQLKLGQEAQAIEQYQAALKQEESLLATSPDNVETLYSQADTYSGLAEVSATLAVRTANRVKRLKRYSDARDWYAKSLNVWQRIPTPAHVTPSLFQVTSPREVARRLSDCNRALAQTRHH